MPDILTKTHRLLVRCVLCVSVIISGLMATGNPEIAYGQENPASRSQSLDVFAAGDAVAVQWHAPVHDAQGPSGTVHLDKRPYGRYLLPMQTIAVRVAGDVSPAAVPSTLVDAPWNGELEFAPELQPSVLDWQPPEWAEPAPEPSLPSQPLFLLRSGRARGQHIAVYAFSEVYQDSSGALRQVLQMDALLPGAAAVTDLSALGASSENGFSATGEEPSLFADVPLPTNALASRRAVKVHVSQGGVQAISARDLADAGLQDPNADNIRVFFRGVQIPLHLFDGDRNGKLTGGESVRFYAPRPGDRWNTEDVYWLVEAANPGKRMTSRKVAAGQAPERNTALEAGLWTANRLFESTLPGPDGDNWFHVSASVVPTDTIQAATAITAELDVHLPLAAPSDLHSVFKIGVTAVDAREDGSAPAQVPHRLRLRGGSVNHTDSPSAWIVDFSQSRTQDFVRSVTTSGQTALLKVGFVPGPETTRGYFDQIEWVQPVRLALGGKGAAFRGVEGIWRYKLSGVPDRSYLYDVTDSLNPVILARTDDSTFGFQDGPDARDYVVAAAGTLFSPRLEAHRPIALTGIQRAHAVYIAPGEFHAALQSLLAHRRNRGLTVEAIDVQEIYDAWSYGFVDPDAIRDFLRYAVGSWTLPPISAVLVGDGTRDPRDYLGFGNPNHIPPYLAHVDPWLHVTACENCYAQLDGDDPLSESAFLTDIWLGRFPVATVSELQAVVDKILRYEQDPNTTTAWRNISVQLADDWIQDDGKKDGAGNFTYFIEETAKLQPPGIRFVRHYYNANVDPALLEPPARAWMEMIKPWIETDQAAAQSKSLALLDGGAGLVTFTGHSNHWAWARMGKTPGYDYRLFGLWDVLQLTNKDALFIGLSMTCLTSQFSHPESSHFTLDEHLVLHPGGGAVAMWGPAGLSVAYGHDALQDGFYSELWRDDAKPGRERLGRLVQAGYYNVALNTVCCQDVTRTFVLLGDPLTPARVQPHEMTYFPGVYASPASQ